MTGWLVELFRHARCSRCELPIRRGELCVRVPEGWVCMRCAASDPGLRVALDVVWCALCDRPGPDADGARTSGWRLYVDGWSADVCPDCQGHPVR